jgi:hypothetical protein
MPVFGSAGIRALNLPSFEEKSLHRSCCELGREETKSSDARIRVCIHDLQLRVAATP